MIAPTANSAVADINAFNNWGLNGCGSTCSRAGFKQTTHFDTGIYCLYSPTAVPDKSMLLVTIDNQHSNTVPGIGSIMWDRSSPNLRVERLRGVHVLRHHGRGKPKLRLGGRLRPRAPKAPEGTLCDDIAFYAEAYVR